MLYKTLTGALLLALAMWLTAFAESINGPEIGQPSPNIIGHLLDDSLYRLKSDTGMPKVINFFWVGCKPCRQEMPELAALEKQFKNVKFISVHTQQETTENVVKFVKSLKAAPSKIVQTSGGIQENFKFLGLPHTMLLDSNNVVLLNLSGYTQENMLQLKKALGTLSR